MIEFRYCCGQRAFAQTEWETAHPSTDNRYAKLEGMTMLKTPLRNTVSGVVTEFDPKTAERMLSHPRFGRVLEVVYPVIEEPGPVVPALEFESDTNPIPVIEEN